MAEPLSTKFCCHLSPLKPVNRAAGGVRARARKRAPSALAAPHQPDPPCAAAASATARRTECRDHPGPAERASSWRMASQPPLEPASSPPSSSLASFLKAATRGSPAVEPHLRRIVQERLESKYACTVNSLRASPRAHRTHASSKQLQGHEGHVHLLAGPKCTGQQHTNSATCYP